MDPFQTKFHDSHKIKIQKPYTNIQTSNFRAPVSSTLRKAEDLMPRDIMSSEPRHWMVFDQLAMPVQCCAGARRRAAGAPAQHCTGMANWSNTIQCLGSDDIMSLGIKSSAFLRVLVLKTVQEFGLSFLDIFWTRRYVKKKLVHEIGPRFCAMSSTKNVHLSIIFSSRVEFNFRLILSRVVVLW